MSELLELYRQLTPNARREFDFAMTIVNAAMAATPAERLDAYDRRGATGAIDTSDFTRADFERLAQIERKHRSELNA